MILVTGFNSEVTAQNYFITETNTDYRRVSFMTDVVELENGNFAFLVNERELPEDHMLPHVYLFDPCGQLITIKRVATDATLHSIPTLSTLDGNIIVNGYSIAAAGNNYYAVLTPDSLQLVQELRDERDVLVFGKLQQEGDVVIEAASDNDFITMRTRNLDLQITSEQKVEHEEDRLTILYAASDNRLYLQHSEKILVYDYALEKIYEITNTDATKSISFAIPKVIGYEKIMVGVTGSDLITNAGYRAIRVYDGDRLVHEYPFENSSDYRWPQTCTLINGLMVCPTDEAIYTYNLDGSPFETLAANEEGSIAGTLGGISATSDGGFVYYHKYSILIDDFWQPVYRLVKANRNFFTSWTPSDACSVSTVETSTTKQLIFPVPATDYIVVTTRDLQAPVVIYDVTGRIVLQAYASNLERVDISILPSGIYYVKVGEQEVLNKLVKL